MRDSEVIFLVSSLLMGGLIIGINNSPATVSEIETETLVTFESAEDKKFLQGEEAYDVYKALREVGFYNDMLMDEDRRLGSDELIKTFGISTKEGGTFRYPEVVRRDGSLLLFEKGEPNKSLKLKKGELKKIVKLVCVNTTECTF